MKTIKDEWFRSDRLWQTFNTPFWLKCIKLSRPEHISALLYNIAQVETYTPIFTWLNNSVMKSKIHINSRLSLYAAQLVLALEYLHSQNIIFREYILYLSQFETLKHTHC